MPILRAVLLVGVERKAPAQHPETDEELSRRLADHLTETFNDDGSIALIRYLAAGEPPEHAEPVTGRWIEWQRRAPPTVPPLDLKPQEIRLDDPHSRFLFRKPFVATQGAVHTFGAPVLAACLLELQRVATEHSGLDYLQVFETPEELPNLWFIEDGQVVTALLPSEY